MSLTRQFIKTKDQSHKTDCHGQFVGRVSLYSWPAPIGRTPTEYRLRGYSITDLVCRCNATVKLTSVANELPA
jgi:hypothetical protein